METENGLYNTSSTVHNWRYSKQITQKSYMLYTVHIFTLLR
jgi:hypothetical protein